MSWWLIVWRWDVDREMVGIIYGEVEYGRLLEKVVEKEFEIDYIVELEKKKELMVLVEGSF